MIIIGTGAGGGTLAHRLAPSGKRILLLERGGYLPREPENWDSRGGLRQGAATCPASSGSTQDGAALQAAPAVLRRRQHEVLRRDPVPAARARLRRGAATTAASRRRGRSPTRTSSPTTPRPSGSTSCTARRGEDPTEPPRSAPFPHPAVSHEPRIQQLARRLRAHRPPPVPPAGRRRPGRDATPRRAAACAATASTASPAWPTARPTRTCCCVRPALEHDNVTLLTHAKVERLETDATRRDGHRRGRRPPRRARRATAPTSWSSRAARSNSAALLLRSASDRHPNGLANSSDVVGRNYMAHINSGVIAISQTPNTTKFQKTLGVNDYYWGADDSELPLGHIQMLGKSDRNILRAGAPWFAPEAGARLHGQARDRLLAHDRGPAAPDNRVTVDRDGTDPPSTRRTTTSSRTSGCSAS